MQSYFEAPLKGGERVNLAGAGSTAREGRRWEPGLPGSELGDPDSSCSVGSSPIL